MICPNCHRQIPNFSESCPNCGIAIVPHEQVGQEIKIRRYQRWVFYAIIIVVFAGMAAYAVKIYLDNTKLLEKITAVEQENSKKAKDLADKEGQLTQKQTQLTQLQQTASESQKLLDQKTEEFKKTLEEKTGQLSQYEEFRVQLGADNANVFKMLTDLSLPVSNNDLSKIALADYNFSGLDSDQDGLSDALEEALGTDKAKADSDDDGFPDKDEILGGYNPLGNGKLPLDQKFSNARKGLILLQIEGQGQAWYVGPKDGKRYFLGRPAEALKALEKLGTAKEAAAETSAGNNENNIEINVE
ncbi:MAG: zinc ribbon domain-containing protein [Patescibacteria group bacterium]